MFPAPYRDGFGNVALIRRPILGLVAACCLATIPAFAQEPAESDATTTVSPELRQEYLRTKLMLEREIALLERELIAARSHAAAAGAQFGRYQNLSGVYYRPFVMVGPGGYRDLASAEAAINLYNPPVRTMPGSGLERYLLAEQFGSQDRYYSTLALLNRRRAQLYELNRQARELGLQWPNINY